MTVADLILAIEARRQKEQSIDSLTDEILAALRSEQVPPVTHFVNWVKWLGSNQRIAEIELAPLDVTVQHFETLAAACGAAKGKR